MNYALLFYGANVFYVPPGPIAKADLYFNRLLPAHQIMIRHVAVPYVMADVMATWDYIRALAYLFASIYTGIWNSKITSICNFYNDQLAMGDQGLERLILEYVGPSLMPSVVLGRKHITERLMNVEHRNCVSETEIFGSEAKKLAASDIQKYNIDLR